MSEYYVLKEGAAEAEGPWAPDELSERLSAGTVSPADFICPPGGAEWRRIVEVFGQPKPPQLPEADPRPQARDDNVICATCGSVSWPVAPPPGSFALELLLWLGGIGLVAFGVVMFAVVVGIPVLLFGGLLCLVALVYSLWRQFTQTPSRCAACASLSIIPTTSPEGRRRVCPVDRKGRPV